jgi:hypothetical protein
MRAPLPVILLAILCTLPAPGVGQTVTMDEGTFSLTIGGRDAGTETFVIRRVGMGADARVIAQGRVELALPEGNLVMEPVLAAAESLSLASYQNKVSGIREEDFTVAGMADRRFQARSVSPRGEQVQEYRAASGTILIEEMVAHHYFLLGARLDTADGSIPVIVPGQGRQLELEFTPGATETLRVGGGEVEGRRVQVTLGGHTREVWFDLRGRVLRVDDPERAYRAERTAPPG